MVADGNLGAIEILRREAAVLNAPWDLPIHYEVSGGYLIGQLGLTVTARIGDGGEEAAKRDIALAMKNAIIATSTVINGGDR